MKAAPQKHLKTRIPRYTLGQRMLRQAADKSKGTGQGAIRAAARMDALDDWREQFYAKADGRLPTKGSGR